jgi:pyroglutamyl-peptidase
LNITILITGFGPFPGAAFNPTEILAEELARRRHPAFANVRRAFHVFTVSYEAIDRDLPALLETHRPDALIMFGLALRAKHVRIETRARNAITRGLPDATGQLPLGNKILAGGPASLTLVTPAQRLLSAARSTGLPVSLSRDPGLYLCNYLCWRAAEAARRGTPRVTSFIHVPAPLRAALPLRRVCISLDDLAEAGEAILRAVISATRQSLACDRSR